MSAGEYDGEPIRGLPALLPKGESILWQGAPDFRKLALRGLHLKTIAIYFVVLGVLGIGHRLSAGVPPLEVAVAMAKFAGLAVVAEGLLALFAWLVARTTVYTITTRRVVIRFGIAMPITIQIPFCAITGAGVKLFADGAGDIALALEGLQKIGYLVLWPHARAWRFAKPEPLLRAVADAAAVAALLGRALAAASEQPAPAVVGVRSTAKTGAAVPATA